LKIFPQLILLCGGYGKRARIIYKNKPKILFPINNKPFIYWILKNLENKGIKKIILCTGYKSNLIQNYIKKEKKNFNINISLSFENPKKLNGTGGAIKKNYKKLDDNFYLMYGDTFLFLELEMMKKKFLEKKKPILMSVFKNKNKHNSNNVRLKRDYLLYDKINNDKMEYIDYGIMIFKKKIFKNISSTSFDLAKLLNYQSKKKQVSYLIKKKSFFEIGDPKSYKNTVKNFKKIYNEIYK
jgi:N-acetyl-alpha-D-muramate 1-phosphate uridylyltransferase